VFAQPQDDLSSYQDIPSPDDLRIRRSYRNEYPKNRDFTNDIQPVRVLPRYPVPDLDQTNTLCRNSRGPRARLRKAIRTEDTIHEVAPHPERPEWRRKTS
jgi:hypothetical protein